MQLFDFFAPYRPRSRCASLFQMRWGRKHPVVELVLLYRALLADLPIFCRSSPSELWSARPAASQAADTLVLTDFARWNVIGRNNNIGAAKPNENPSLNARLLSFVLLADICPFYLFGRGISIDLAMLLNKCLAIAARANQPLWGASDRIDSAASLSRTRLDSPLPQAPIATKMRSSFGFRTKYISFALYHHYFRQ